MTVQYTGYERTIVTCNLCTEQLPKESDDTRCCTNTIVLLKMSIIVLETCRAIYMKCIKIKNLCIKLVKKDYHYIRIHGQQNRNLFCHVVPTNNTSEDGIHVEYTMFWLWK